MIRTLSLSASLAATLLLGGCIISDDSESETPPATTPAPQPGEPAAAPPVAAPDLRLEVDLAARQLRVYRGESILATHPVAVGSREWPTPTGEWTISQVIFNPRWIPPEEAWAEDEEEKEPGAPDNPLGHAQLVYSAPNSIHGTNQPESLGKAVSHGSIRVANEVAVELARLVMEAGGAPRDSAWFRQVQQNRSVRQEVEIPNPVPIQVVEGSGPAAAAPPRPTG